jgi:hypothetical protein
LGTCRLGIQMNIEFFIYNSLACIT